MRGLLALTLVFSIWSCSSSDPVTETIEESVKMQDTMEPEVMETPETAEGTEPDGEVIEDNGLLEGDFVDGAHPTSGKAILNESKTKLNLIAFKTDAGPLLEFYLATDLDGVDYVSLGELQGLDGNYTYDIPDGVNFNTHKYLMVWCVDFSVSFGHAVLE